MKALGITLAILALVTGIVPQFSDCQSQGRSITLADGRTIPMKCHWTARAELALSIPLLAAGLLLAFTRRKEMNRALSVVSLGLGLGIVLLPTALIGVCGNPDMVCNMIMRPTLLAAGILTMAVSAFALVRVVAFEPRLAVGTGR